MQGQRVSHYQITTQLGAGGMGVVYAAHDTKLDRQVALKFLPPEFSRDPRAKARFMREARSASALDHPNICAIHEIDETDDGRLFIVMACYEGETLADRLSAGGLPAPEAILIAQQIVAGLVHAHVRGIVHRDIKPANVFLCSDGQVKVLDFGLARGAEETRVTRIGAVVGTGHYMSPEQAEGGEVDYRSDIWSLGILLREMLADQPQAAVAVIDRCLQKDRDQRYQDTGDLLADLGGWPDRAARKPNRLLALRLAIAALVVAAAVIVGRGLLYPPPPSNLRILVPEMEDLTRDGDLGLVLREALVIDMQQSRFVHVFAGRSLANALTRMGKAPAEPLTPDLAAEVAQREGIPVVLTSSVLDLGGGYLVTVKLVDPTSGEAFHMDSAQVPGRDELLVSLDDLTRNIRERLGESDRAIALDDEPLARVTTPSLAALQLYSQGLRAGRSDRGVALLKQAVAADTTFAMAYAQLARTLFYRANTRSALAYSQRAFDLRDDLPARERLYIEGEYYRYRAQYDKAVEALTTLLELHPDAVDSRYDLIAAYTWAFRHHNALRELGKFDDATRQQAGYKQMLGITLADLGEFAEASNTLREAIAQQPSPALSSRLCLTWSLIGERKLDAASAQIDTMLALDADQAVGANYLVARALPALGRFDEAVAHLEIARGRALSVGDTDQVAWTYLYAARCLSRAGDHDGAVAAFHEAIRLWPGFEPLLWLGVVSAEAGDLVGGAEAERRLEELVAAGPTPTNQAALRHLRGQLALNRGEYTAAITLLSQCPLELDARLALGRAQAAVGDLAAARTQFEFVLENRMTAFKTGLSSVWPLAHYYLGVVAQEVGDVVEAVRQYQLFLELWGEAVAVVEVQDAEFRVGKLRGDGE